MKSPASAMLSRVDSPSLIHVCALASGGMGRVEVAVRRGEQFERLFAVKRLHVQYAEDPAVRDMFLDEARIAGLIQHPNVVHVVDVGADEEGPFLVMEYVEGLSLSEVIKHHVQEEKLIPLSVGLDIVRQVALGLQAAHELTNREGQRVGLIHRDVSPQNVMVSYDGCARLTDFGIAKASERLTKTHTGVLKGKYGYLSPEQLRFEDPTQASDLFSLGVVLFEVLACRRLYGQGGLKAARQVLNEPPPDLADDRPDVPSEIIGLVFRLLAKDSEHRPESARVVADALQDALRGLDDEERVAPSDYMSELFGDQQKARRAKIAKILKGIDHSSQRSVSSSPPSATMTRRESPPPSRRGFLYAAIATCVLVAGGVSAATWTAQAPIAAPAKLVQPQSVRAELPQPVPLASEATRTPLVVPPIEEAASPRATMMQRRGGTSTRMNPSGRAWVQEW